MTDVPPNDDVALALPAIPPPAAPPVTALAESTLIRSIYLYAVCLAALAFVVLGSVMAVTSAFRIVAPDAGQRDNIDRIVVGLSNIADDITDDFLDVSNPALDPDQYCDGFSDEQACRDDLADEASNAESQRDELSSSIADVTSTIRHEINSQIRWGATGKLVAGLAIVVAGGLVFRRHSRKVGAYA